MAEMTDQEFVEMVVKAIVDDPKGVSTKRSVDEMGVLVELTVAPEDMGKIIGKEGRTAKAVRTLLRVFGAKNNARINLKIVEPEGSERPERKSDEEVAAPAEEKAEEVEEAKAEDIDDVPTDVLA
ncbi:MAG: KH domain-containing protein [Candidatus Berkelbacteria bacterium]